MESARPSATAESYLLFQIERSRRDPKALEIPEPARKSRLRLTLDRISGSNSYGYESRCNGLPHHSV